MHLTLFAPDLLWPDVEHAAAFDFPGAEPLARLLSLAERTQTPLSNTASWQSRLAELFGFTGEHLPLAALRTLGEGFSSTGPIVCADPVHLNFVQQALVLSPIAADTLTYTEAESLRDSLNNEFAGSGKFVIHSQDGVCHWYFIPDGDASDVPDMAASSRLAGRRIDADETRQLLGRDALRWLNRIQMCLNQHPVNEARETQGLPTINSLWPWGLGRLAHLPEQRFSRAIGQSALLTGLCQATRTPLAQSSSFIQAEGHLLVTDLDLSNAVSHDNLVAWQTGIAKLVADWIAAALTALTAKNGALQSLTLIGVDAHQEQRWTLDRTNPRLRGNLLQRCLGLTPKTPTLSALVRSWSV